MADEAPDQRTVNTVLNDWLRRPDEGPFETTVTQDGATWAVTGQWRDGWLDWRIESGGWGEWGLGRRIIAGQAGG